MIRQIQLCLILCLPFFAGALQISKDQITGDLAKARIENFDDRLTETSRGLATDTLNEATDRIVNPTLYDRFMDMPLSQKLMLGAGLGYGTDYIMQLAEVGPYEEEKESWEDYQGGSSQNPSWRGRGSPSFSSVYPSTREINYYYNNR